MAESSAMSMETKARPWWLLLIDGILAVIIGILILTSPKETALFLVIFLGVYWVIRGIFDIISMFVDHTAWGWKLFVGILGILAGMVLLRTPVVSVLVLPQIIIWIGGLYGVFGGILLIVQAFRGGGWGVGILGALLIVLGIVILGFGLMQTAALAAMLYWVAGFLLVIGGIVAIVQAFRQRD